MFRGSKTLLVGICLISFGCSASEWNEYSPDGYFKVSVPGILEEQNPPNKKPSDQIWGFQERYGQYLIIRSDLRTPVATKSIEPALNELVKDLVATAEAKLRSTKPIEITEKYAAIELEADHSTRSASLRAKIILHENRIYQVIISGDNPWMSMAKPSQFLQSFRLID
jgi:hypothetical protein